MKNKDIETLVNRSIERAKSICEADGEALAKYIAETMDADYAIRIATQDSPEAEKEQPYGQTEQ